MLANNTTKFLLICLVLLAVLLLYLPGTTGAMYYDDYGNLEKLEDVVDIPSALDFITSGIAGPLGRPIALASFVIHKDHWPNATHNILFLNILIHLINGFLIYLLTQFILKAKNNIGNNRIFLISLSTCFLWMILPMLASSNLIAIQRMTGLSSLFGLVGLLIFTYLYRYKTTLFNTSLQLGSLGLFVLLALYTKESAFQILLYALIIDFLLSPNKNENENKEVRIARRALLVIPLLFLIYYLSPLRSNWFDVILHRGFSPWERLQSQFILLWEYIRLIIAPVPFDFGPFHDDRVISNNNILIIISCAAWLTTIMIAFWLYKRKITIWFLFAVTWFLAGHALESTTIGLELYFEHRNYLAVLGLCLSISIFFCYLYDRIGKIAIALFGAYIAIQAASLYVVTSTWGQPLVAAQMWTDKNPASSRAITHQAFQELSAIDGSDVADMSYQLIRNQRKEFMLERMNRSIAACPECIDIQLEALTYSCELEVEVSRLARLDPILQNAMYGRGALVSINALFRIRDHVINESCKPVNEHHLLSIIDELLENPRFSTVHFQARLLFLSAALHEDLENFEQRDEQLRKAEQVFRNGRPVLEYQVHSSIKELRFDDARNAIERRANSAIDANTLDALHALVDDAESEYKKSMIH